MEKMDLRLITTFDAFKALEVDWNEIYEQSDYCSIFSSWDWVTIWWDVFHKKTNKKLFILCVYSENELIGIAPLYIEKNYPLAILQGKTLRFIGSSSKNEIMTELSDFIVKDKFEVQFISVVSDFLKENRKLWDFADFEFLEEDSLVLKCFDQPKKGISIEKIQYGVRYLLPKLNSLDEYLNLISSRKKKDFNRVNRVLERDGGSSIETIESPEQIEPFYNRLADMHRERWQGKLDSCIFDMPEFNEFHLKILNRLSSKNKADIVTLNIEGEALSSMYLFEDKGKVHYYQSGFYTKNANKYSPLFHLICMQVGIASEDNKTFDFMFDEDPESYKGHQYRAEAKKMYRLKLTPQPLRFIVYHCLRNFIRTLRSSKLYIERRLSS